ncbi:MAG: cation:proton antiporter [archaeon]
MDNIFFDIGIMIVAAALLGYLAKLGKQPMIPAYIFAGIIVGPIMGWVTDIGTIKLLAEIGIAFLLFGVGLELELKKLKDIGAVGTVGALIHMGVLFLIGFAIAIWQDMIPLWGVYIGILLMFSSTMVVIKLLSDKKELNTLHGRIVIAMLLVQDIVAIIIISILGNVTVFEPMSLLFDLAKGVGIFIFAILIGKAVLPFVFKFAAKNQELLLMISVGMCFLLAMLFHQLGFSIVIGAFLAGVILGNLPYNQEIAGRVKPLKSFFAVLFFTALGAELVISNFAGLVPMFVILTVLTAVAVPLVTIIVCSMFGYKRRTAFLAGVALAQVSEFSLIIFSQGLDLGHITPEFFSLAIVTTIMTVTITTYFINYEYKLYGVLSKPLMIFEKLSKKNKELSFVKDDVVHHTVMIGYDRLGYSILKTLERLKKDYVVVDFNPDVVKRLLSRRIPCIYGDIENPELLEKLNLEKVELVISTVPVLNANQLLIKKIKEVNAEATVIVTSTEISDALQLYDLGADYVIIPHYLGGQHISIMLEDISTNIDSLINAKISHIRELKLRKELHPHHK